MQKHCQVVKNYSIFHFTIIRGFHMRLAHLLLAGAALVASTTAANATFVVYTSQAAFLAAVTAPGVDTYTGFNINGSTQSPITRSAGTYTYSATASGDGLLYGAGTTANPWLSTNQALSSITFANFTGGANAIGGNFFGSDIAGAFAAGSVTLTAVDATGTSTQTITNATTSSFLGFVSTGGLSSLTISAVQPAGGTLWPTVDNLTIARTPAAGAVPETATWGMMILGFGMMGASARYRRRSTKTSFA